MRTIPHLLAAGLIGVLTVAAGGAAVMADHSDAMTVRGVVTQFTLAANTTAGATAVIGTITIDSGNEGLVSLSVLPSTRFALTGTAMSDSLFGTPVKVRAGEQGGTLDALQVSTDAKLADRTTNVKGTVTAVSSTSLSLRTEDGRDVTDALSPTALVSLGDQPGTLADIAIGARVKARWQVANREVEVISVRIQHSHMRDQTFKGTVIAMQSGFLTLATKRGTITEAMLPTALVFASGHRIGTLADIRIGSRAKVYSQTVDGQEDIVAVHVKGDD